MREPSLTNIPRQVYPYSFDGATCILGRLISTTRSGAPCGTKAERIGNGQCYHGYD